MKTIITGAGGLVGGVLSRRLAASGNEVLAPRRADLDVTDAVAVERLVGAERPSLVVNCAVLGVDECERDPEAARAVNVEAPRALARAAAGACAAFLHFSTNYVFDGEGERFYAEEDEPRPSSVYGRTKADGERVALDANARTLVVRTSWVFGAGKRSFLSTAHSEMRAGRRVRAIKDTWASVTYVEDLAARVEELLALNARGLFHVVNEGVCTYEEFAREAARLAGLGESEAAPLVETVTESEMRRPAPRPRYTPLRCLAAERLGLAPLRDWRAALAEYVGQDER
jgi:dTDP-4-dehydrorhamnose reductase